MLERHVFLKWTTLAIFSVFSIILSISQDLYGATIDAEIPRKDKLESILLSGKNVYHHYCVHCHGQGGKGDGKSFPYELEPKPRNFTDAKYMGKLKDSDIQQVITSGSASLKKSNLCPAWGKTFEEKKIKELIAYVRAFSAPSSKEKKPAEVAVSSPEETNKETVGATPFIVWPILTLLSGFFIWIALLEWRDHIFFLKGRP